MSPQWLSKLRQMWLNVADKLHVSSYPNKFPHYTWIVVQSVHSNFVRLRVYACLAVTCHLHSWQNDKDLLCASEETRG